jgi:hypothetical protein
LPEAKTCAQSALDLRTSSRASSRIGGEERLDEVLTRARHERHVVPVEEVGIRRSNRMASSSTGSSTASFTGGMSFADSGLTMRFLLRPSRRTTTARRSLRGERRPLSSAVGTGEFYSARPRNKGLRDPLAGPPPAEELAEGGRSQAVRRDRDRLASGVYATRLIPCWRRPKKYATHWIPRSLSCLGAAPTFTRPILRIRADAAAWTLESRSPYLQTPC